MILEVRVQVLFVFCQRFVDSRQLLAVEAMETVAEVPKQVDPDSVLPSGHREEITSTAR